MRLLQCHDAEGVMDVEGEKFGTRVWRSKKPEPQSRWSEETATFEDDTKRDDFQGVASACRAVTTMTLDINEVTHGRD